MHINNLISKTSEIIKKTYGIGGNGKSTEESTEITKLFNNTADLFMHVLKESPEFRGKIAEIHNEFLKYPESRSAIEKVYNEVSGYQRNTQMEAESKLNRH